MNELRHLDLNLLKALEALLDEQNVSRAAQKMAVTQSAMSGMLARLRESFGEPLFVRTQYGIIPTERAAALHRSLKQALSDINALWQPPEFDPYTAELTLRVGATDYGFYSIGVPFLNHLHRFAPHIRTAFVPVQSGDVAQRLAKGELDFAVITRQETLPDFHTATLYEEHYLCALREGHPLAGRLNLDAFCDAEHLMVSYQGGGFSGTVDDALAALGRSRTVRTSVSSFLIAPDILRRTDLVATVPARLLEGQTGLAVSPPPLPVPGFTKLLAWHERTHHSTAFKWLRMQFRALFGPKETSRTV